MEDNKKKGAKKGKQKDKDVGGFNASESNQALMQGEQLYRAKKKDQAYEKFKQAIQFYQENDVAHGRLAELMIEREEYVPAHGELENAIQYKPNRAWYYFLNGEIFSKTGQWEEALNEYKRAVEVNEQEIEPNYYFKIAEMEYQLQKYQSAINNYDKSDKMVQNMDSAKIKNQKTKNFVDNEKYLIYLGRGKCYRELKKKDLALLDMQKAEGMKKEDPVVLANVGLTHMMLGQYEKAKTSFKSAYDKNPDDADYCDNLGLACYHCSDQEDALKYYEEAIKKDKNRAQSHYHKGQIYLDKKDYENAKKSLDLAIKIAPTDAVYFHAMGTMYQKKADPSEYDLAIEFYQRAISLKNNHIPSYYHLGQVYHLKHMLNEAFACYHKVLTIPISEKDNETTLRDNEDVTIHKYYFYY